MAGLPLIVAEVGKDARCLAPSPNHQPLTPSTSSPQPPWQNHPRSPASNSFGRSVVNCQAKSKPHAMGTLAAVLSVYLPSSNGTIVANPRHRRGAGVASSRCVGWRSSNPSPCWLRLGTAERRPRIRSCLRRSRRLRRGSVAAPERSGSYECHGLRGARPLAPGCSCGSFPNRCRPIVARMFPMVCEAHRSDSGPRSLAKRGWLFSPDSLPANFSHKIIRL